MSHFETKKSLGQHFLRSPEMARKIAISGEISPGETVVEIGPGTGILTEALLALGARVIAIEADERAIPLLEERFHEAVVNGKLTILHRDVRTVELSSLGLPSGSFKIVANIPYYISGLLFRWALSGSVKPSLLVFLVQKEVAERIARTKKESLLSIGVKAYGDPEYVMTVKKGAFVPPPKVDSAVLRVRRISQEHLKGIPDEQFFNLVHRGFGSRRKQLFGALKSVYGEDMVREAFESAKLNLKVRGEDLSIEEWVLLAQSLETHRTT